MLLLSLTATDARAGSVLLRWEPPLTFTDGTPINPAVDIASYTIFLGTASGQYTSSITVVNTFGSGLPYYQAVGLNNNYPWYTTSQAVGQSGSTSTYSGEACIAFQAPPPAGCHYGLAYLLSPLDGATLSASVAVVATPTVSAAMISKIQLQLDGANLGQQITSPPYTYTWNTTLVQDGYHSLALFSYDSSNNLYISTISVTVANVIPTITSAGSALASTGSSFSYQIVATNNPTSYGASGLPPGLSVNTASGLISGTATSIGTFNVTLTAANSGGIATKALALTVAAVPVITSAIVSTATTTNTYGYQITATNNPTSFGASGLPAGLSINTATGLISGTPTSSGAFSVSLTATNTAGTGSATLSLTVNGAISGAPVITSTPAVSAVLGVAFNYQITATNSPTSFGASGLPPGITVNNATGLISGTPTSGGVFNSTVTATNASGMGISGLAVTVSAPPSITSPLTASALIGVAFTYQITATNNPSTFTAAGLAAGLSLNSTNGLISGVPTSSGTYTIALGASNIAGTGSAGLVLTIGVPPPVINSPRTATATIGTGTLFSYQITATNMIGPFIPAGYNATGLPPALSVNTVTGLISGVPTTLGTYIVTLTATNAGGTGSNTLTITVKNPGGTFATVLVYPNPAVNADPTLRAFMPAVDMLQITITDVRGRVVHSASLAGTPTGILNGQSFFDYRWQGRKASGIYFAQIHGKTADGKLIKTKVRFAVVN